MLMNNYREYVFGAFGALVGFLFGDWKVTMGILLALNFFDFFTGIWKASHTGNVTSRKMHEGLEKKFSMWLLVILGHFIDVLVFQSGAMAANMVIFAFIYNEGTSLIENANALGVKVPDVLVNSMGKVNNLSKLKVEKKSTNSQSDNDYENSPEMKK